MVNPWDFNGLEGGEREEASEFKYTNAECRVKVKGLRLRGETRLLEGLDMIGESLLLPPAH